MCITVTTEQNWLSGLKHLCNQGGLNLIPNYIEKLQLNLHWYTLEEDAFSLCSTN